MLKTFFSRRFASYISNNTFKCSVTQITSSNNKEENFEICQKLVQEAKEQDSSFIFFPENFSFMERKSHEILDFGGEFMDSELMQAYFQLAKEYDIYISYGGFYERIEGEEKVFNTHVIVNNEGEVISKYHKMHLFDISLPEVEILESNRVFGGDEIVACETPFGTYGITSCYDIRFPEMYRYLTTDLEANVLVIPASFTIPTGKVHWETLLRARSIENQCFVIAATQTGKKWGHSMIIDPFGTVLVDMDRERENELDTIEIDLQRVEEVRKNMPCFQHRRNDVYEILYNNETEEQQQKGGEFEIDWETEYGGGCIP